MVGAGQLARMTCQAAIGLGIGFRVLAETPADSAALVCADVVTGDYTDSGDLLAFARGCDVVTFDHEHVPGGHLAELEKAAAGQASAAVRPGTAALRYTQDKLAMRERLGALGVPCPRYAPVTDLAGVRARAEEWGWPVVLKAVTGGYDGRGVWVCGTPEEAAAVLAHPVAVFAEEHVAFDAELAALVARSPYGQAAAYPVVQTVQRGGVCHEVFAPAPGLPAGQAMRGAADGAGAGRRTGRHRPARGGTVRGRGQRLARQRACDAPAQQRPLDHRGQPGRPSSSSTCARCSTCRSATRGWPRPQAVMANVFGASSPDIFSRYEHVMAADPGVKVHLYGKQVRPGRKIGHVTVLGGDVAGLRERAARAASYLATGNEESA